MDADEVYSIVDKRITAHEKHCQERQTIIHGLIRNNSRLIYIGVGIMLTVEIIGMTGIAHKVFG